MDATELRQRLSDYHSFLTLAWAISANHSPISNETRAFLGSLSEFLTTASDRDVYEKGRRTESLLIEAATMHESMLPRKKAISEIAHDFRLLVKSEPGIDRSGIPLGWLLDRFDVSRLPQIKDLPGHARIGIGIHAGLVTVEEISLLDDMFFLLVRARKSFADMMTYASSLPQDIDLHNKSRAYVALSAFNSAVCTFSRLGVLTSAAFVEAFVNSVGWNEAASRPGISDSEREVLLGMRKGNYLSLEAKLERLPRIIRSDGKTPIVISDEKQRREPFITFFTDTKEVRDASMHYAPGKAPILHAPNEWIQLVESAVINSVAVAREFWIACYPDRDQPSYLAGLYYEGLQQHALDRLAAAEDAAIAPPDSSST